MSTSSPHAEELERIRSMIDLCPESVTELGHLVAELESTYLNYLNMSVPSEELKSKFYEQWASLEEVFAVSLDRGQATLTEEGKKIVVEALCALRSVIEKIQGQ